MTLAHREEPPHEDPDAPAPAASDEPPETLPPKAWITLILFAAFVVAAGGCGAAHLLW